MPENPTPSSFWKALGIAWEFGWVIVIPLVVFVLGGRLLDRHFGTSPWWLLTGLIVSITLTTIGLVWKFKKLLRSIEDSSQPPSSKP
ncbi:MAG: AtpZ/AtpI family protein [Patescibacteria group bacterium]